MVAVGVEDVDLAHAGARHDRDGVGRVLAAQPIEEWREAKGAEGEMLEARRAAIGRLPHLDEVHRGAVAAIVPGSAELEVRAWSLRHAQDVRVEARHGRKVGGADIYMIQP